MATFRIFNRLRRRRSATIASRKFYSLYSGFIRERDGLSIAVHGRHRPIESYFRALEAAGLLVEALRETELPEHGIVKERSRRWQRLPLFLHLRARRA